MRNYNASFIVGRLRSVWRSITPSPLTPIPTPEDVERRKHQTAVGIVSRQAEGSVLLSAGRFNMDGVDLFEDEQREVEAK